VFIPYPKVALYIESGPSGKHLFVIVTAPTKSCDDILLLNFTSIYEGAHFDPACVVEPGEHPFITKKSYVFYNKAMIRSSKEIELKIRENKISIHSKSVSQDLFNKIIAGISTSKEIPTEIIDFYDSRVA
jgi:hypothetical protein